MTAIDELLQRHSIGIDHGAPEVPTPVPCLHLAIVTCMDARIKVFDVFGLRHGEAHILRNAGGVVTDDIIRSLAISQRKLETREVIVMQHTSCGLSTDHRRRVQGRAGARHETAADRGRSRRSARSRTACGSRWNACGAARSCRTRDHVRGFVYDVTPPSSPRSSN